MHADVKHRRLCECVGETQKLKKEICFVGYTGEGKED